MINDKEISNLIEACPDTPSALFNKWFRSIPKDYIVALLSTIILGIITHLFIYMNSLFLGDGLKYYYGPLTNFTTRWFTDITSEIFFDYLTLPWAIGLTALFIMSFSVFTLYRFFDLQSNFARILVSAVMVTFPTYTAIHAYMSSAHAFALAMLTACLAAYIMINVRNKWIAMVTAILLLILCLSTYQAYICVTAALIIFNLLRQIIIDETETKEIIILGFRCLFVLLVSAGLYFLLVSALSINLNGMVVDSQTRGITPDNIFVQIKDLIRFIPASIRHVIDFYFADLMTFNTRIVNYSYALMFLSGFSIIGWYGFKNTLHKKPIRLLLTISLIIILPISMNVFYILQVKYYFIHILMCHAFCIPIIFSIYLLDKAQISISINKRGILLKTICWGISLALFILIYNYWLLANITYAGMNKAFNESLLEANRIVYEIQSSEGYKKETPVLMIDSIGDTFNYVKYESYITRNGFEKLNSMYGAGMPLSYWEKGSTTEYFNWLAQEHLGVELNLVGGSYIMERDPRFWEMPIYPEQGYLQVIDGTVVAKFYDARSVDVSLVTYEEDENGCYFKAHHSIYANDEYEYNWTVNEISENQPVISDSYNTFNDRLYIEMPDNKNNYIVYLNVRNITTNSGYVEGIPFELYSESY